MNPEWRLIWQGFGIALLGAVATMGYILALSNLLVGAPLVAAANGVGAVVLGIVFNALLRPYLDALERRSGGDEGKE
jgi:hypothetical protein